MQPCILKIAAEEQRCVVGFGFWHVLGKRAQPKKIVLKTDGAPAKSDVDVLKEMTDLEMGLLKLNIPTEPIGRNVEDISWVYSLNSSLRHPAVGNAILIGQILCDPWPSEVAQRLLPAKLWSPQLMCFTVC